MVGEPLAPNDGDTENEAGVDEGDGVGPTLGLRVHTVGWSAGESRRRAGG
jgi:hypothetical protein